MQKIEKKQVVMSVAVVILATAFIFFQYLPLNKKAEVLKEANAALLTENAAADARESVLPQLLEEIKKLKEQIGNFDAKIPAGRSHGVFLQDITSIMQKDGLEELMVQPGAETETDGLSLIPVYIRCKGGLTQIFKFFRALDSFERIIQIEEVSLTTDNTFDGEVTMQAKVNIFYRTN
ncbi:MAG: type 4a pilus biogenesis protein PilO [Phycisphaerae bacterium]|nr:type 4a pilus biogenesis protein PilO [Phycisphaerae bacterium]